MDLSEVRYLETLQQSLHRGLEAFGVAEPKSLTKWAEENFYLSAESSYVEQRWEAWPFQRAILAAMSHDDIREVVFMKSARVGYTKMLLAAIGYGAEHQRRNQCVWQPTDDDADSFVKSELDTMLRDVKAMEAAFPAFMSRHKDNTLTQKKFVGSLLHIRGGKAAKNYRRISVDTAILDELDGFDTDIEKEGSPVNLARKRVEGATFPKLILGSTPKLKGLSLIEGRFDDAEQKFRRHQPCPHCGELHPLTWGGKDKPHGFKWTGSDPDTVLHYCPHCGEGYDQGAFLRVARLGVWISDTGMRIVEDWDADEIRFVDADGRDVQPPRSVGFHVWTAYSPITTWAQIVREFLSAMVKAAAGDKAELKTFVNTTLGETWEEDVEKTDAALLAQRAEPYALRTVPRRALLLVLGVDVQGWGFDLVLWGIGRGEEMWVIDHQQLTANPAVESEWELLDAYIDSTFPHAGGQRLKIECTGIDTGGHYTHQCYNFCRTRARKRVFALKGESQEGRPIKSRASKRDVNCRGETIKNGVKLYMVGTDTAKDLLYGRLQVAEPGPGYIHFPVGLELKFYEQLTAEVRVVQRTPGGEKHRWVLPAGKRNEVLDCAVYSMWCVQMLDLHRYTDKMWERLEQIVNPPTADLFAAPQAEAGESDVQTVTHGADLEPPAASAPPLQALQRRGRRIHSRGIAA